MEGCGERQMDKMKSTDKSAHINDLIVEIKLSINRRLFEKGYITEEMHIKAKELIIKQSA